MAVEAINEYLTAAGMCLEFRKPDGGCLGYPSVLLLLCVTNALGSYLKSETVIIANRPQRITRGEPFRVFNHGCFDLDMTQKQIKQIEDYYRNRLAHTAVIKAGAFLLPSDDDPAFVFQTENGMAIRVFSFYRSVARACSRIPVSQIQAWEEATSG